MTDAGGLTDTQWPTERPGDDEALFSASSEADPSLLEAILHDDGEPTDTSEPTEAGRLTDTQGPGGQQALLSGRSEDELSALRPLLDLIAVQSGRLDSRVKRIQDSPQIRRFVVAAVRAVEAAQAAGNDSDSY